MPESPKPKTPPAASGASPGGRRLRVLLPTAGLLVLLVGFNLHRSIASLPPVCPPAGPRPTRIVSLSLGTDEVLLDLVPPERIAALTYLSVNPEFSNVAERARALPRHFARSVEEMARLRPDLVLATSFNDPEKVESLRALGCRVVTLSRFDSLDGVRRNVVKVAAAVGEPARGRALVARMDRTLREAARFRREGAKKPRVLFVGPGGYTQGRGTTVNDLIRRAGGVNAAAERLYGIGKLSLEEWLSLKPDVLLRMSFLPLDPFLVELFRAAGRDAVPAEVVMPSRLLTAVSPSSARAIRLLAERLREVAP
ncbi:MAG: ABC transporter substrate-binding protein [Planctomycetota bacterium]